MTKTTYTRQVNLLIKEILKRYNIDNLQLEMDLSSAISSLVQESKKGSDPAKVKQDILDGLLHYAQTPEAREYETIESMLVEIEKGLRIRLGRTTDEQLWAKRFLKEAEEGRPFSEWLKWCKDDEWRLAHLYIYADLSKLWIIYPQAFNRESKKTKIVPR